MQRCRTYAYTSICLPNEPQAASLVYKTGDPVMALSSIREAIAALSLHAHLRSFQEDLKELHKMERRVMQGRK